MGQSVYVTTQNLVMNVSSFDNFDHFIALRQFGKIATVS